MVNQSEKITLKVKRALIPKDISIAPLSVPRRLNAKPRPSMQCQVKQVLAEDIQPGQQHSQEFCVGAFLAKKILETF